MPRATSGKVFFIIIFSQFCGTSLWFATNAILPQLQSSYGWHTNALGYLTSAVQLGFIVGTLVFAITGITDKRSPSKIFFVSSLIAASCNAIVLIDPSSFGLMLTSRALTGFFLAGIYPVGMKIAADWNEEGLGHWLGALVGALVVGTAFPHGLKLIPQFVEPNVLVMAVSLLALFGGLLVFLLIKDGPFRKPATHFSFSEITTAFKSSSFRAPAFGYFGHMWELYAFWAFVPWAVTFYLSQYTYDGVHPSLFSFLIIGVGGIGCIVGGRLSVQMGSKRIAQTALISSGICCLISPFIWSLSFNHFFAIMLFWGFMAAADSPQFSALVAANAPVSVRGSAITITICIGFAISIITIQLLAIMQSIIAPQYLFLLLAPGPIGGVLLLNRQ
ncbi:MAG TPA: MFS transporter [Cyclobacteriaceae bacterium]|nr:MFS transporter [Cyclobacteriaceae bacterium]